MKDPKTTNSLKPIIVGISGASGSILAQETVNALLERLIPTIVVCSNDAKLVWQEEMDEPFNQRLSAWQEHPHFRYYSMGEMRSPIASGTYPTAGMVIVPCSMASAASIAHGLANNLLLRAADVCLKERRRLVLVPRETPLHAVHLENLTKLAQMGAVILPPEPAFYLRPQRIEEVVHFIVSRILVALTLEETLPDRYQYHSRDK